ncbi:hypothetical protein [Sphingobacterium hungaricum]|uniref:Lipocalin-like domain-containing protein n=1 Tax=Sphingobacterium hungaricum TaxID=2082723 RepID=A0A928UZQ6_9SPHI|nr:hypothetical protein [Sphingobacterium hungaricum]MBE8715068.1 hypothetical protein [Sphingobacterium hungaricum]
MKLSNLFFLVLLLVSVVSCSDDSYIMPNTLTGTGEQGTGIEGKWKWDYTAKKITHPNGSVEDTKITPELGEIVYNFDNNGNYVITLIILQMDNGSYTVSADGKRLNLISEYEGEEAYEILSMTKTSLVLFDLNANDESQNDEVTENTLYFTKKP